jgi:hypothetical protein
MNDAHKIAGLEKDVHILYVAEMAQNSRLLLFYTSESPKFSSIPNVNCYGTVKRAGLCYGKKSQILNCL